MYDGQYIQDKPKTEWLNLQKLESANFEQHCMGVVGVLESESEESGILESHSELESESLNFLIQASVLQMSVPFKQF